EARRDAEKHRRSGAPASAQPITCSDKRCTIQGNKPIEQPHTVAIRSKTPQPAATDMPPCTVSTSAIHGTQGRTKIRPCRKPQKKAKRACARKTPNNSSARQNQE